MNNHFRFGDNSFILLTILKKIVTCEFRTIHGVKENIYLKFVFDIYVITVDV